MSEIEEVLSQDNAIWIANSGKRMVYASFDDRQVDQMEFSLYGNPSSVQYQYPVTTSIRYPKVTYSPIRMLIQYSFPSGLSLWGVWIIENKNKKF